jgi:hypothetical protein
LVSDGEDGGVAVEEHGYLGHGLPNVLVVAHLHLEQELPQGVGMVSADHLSEEGGRLVDMGSDGADAAWRVGEALFDVVAGGAWSQAMRVDAGVGAADEVEFAGEVVGVGHGGAYLRGLGCSRGIGQGPSAGGVRGPGPGQDVRSRLRVRPPLEGGGMFVRCAALAVGLVMVSGTASAQETDWKSKISATLVEVDNQQMTWRSVQLCRNEDTGKSLQIQATAKAPEGVGISRDFFLSFASAAEGLILGTMLGTVAGATQDMGVFESFQCKEIESAIGTPDVTIGLSLTGDGWQMEVTAGGKTERHTERWADSFAK